MKKQVKKLLSYALAAFTALQCMTVGTTASAAEDTYFPTYKRTDAYSSGVQGTGGWYFMYENAAGEYVKMTGTFSGKDARFDEHFMVPGFGVPVVLAWEAPYTGTVTLTEQDNVYRNGPYPTGGDVTATLKLNDTILTDDKGKKTQWVFNNTCKNGIGNQEYTVTGLHVDKGDVIYHKVDCGTNNTGAAIYWKPIVTYTECEMIPDAQATFKRTVAFSDGKGVQGYHGWYFYKKDKTTNEYVPLKWDSSQFRLDDTHVNEHFALPGSNAPAVIAWKAPYTGTVKLTHQDSVYRDGASNTAEDITATLKLNNNELWSHIFDNTCTNTPGKTAIYTIEDVHVNAGDVIYHEVDCGTNTEGRSIYWKPIVTYTEMEVIPDKTQTEYKRTVAYPVGAQGYHGWYFYKKNITTNEYVPLKWESSQYKLDDTYVNEHFALPGSNAPSVIAWKAPYTGTIKLTHQDTVYRDGAPETAGDITATIKRNNDELWSHTFDKTCTNTPGKTATYTIQDVHVNAGDVIYHEVDCGTNTEGRYIYWKPIVTYTAFDEVVNVEKVLAITNISETGGVDNNDTLQNAVALGQATIKVGGTDVNALADATDAQTPGEVVVDSAKTIDISLIGNSQGKDLKNLDVIMKSDLKNNKGCCYDLTFQYKKVGETGFTTFYQAVSTRKPGQNITYPAVRLSAKEINKVTNIDTIRIISNSADGVLAAISEIDLNTTEDSAEVAAAKTAKVNELTLNKLYQDNMMFQQNKPIRITGKGGNGTVTATLSGAGKTYTKTTAGNPDGWVIELDAVAGSFDKYTLTVTDGVTTKTVSNILIGELWLASGQSNMAFILEGTSHRDEDKQNANNENIRFFIQNTSFAPMEPSENSLEGKWYDASTGDNLTFASAVAYHFALNLYEQLDETVPVGFMQAALGGATLQGFVPETFLTENGYEKYNDSKAHDTYDETDALPLFRLRATGVYNGSVNPIKNMNFGGVIWYQGEGNTSNTEDYKKMQPEFIGFMRNLLRDEELPFILTQLPSYGAGDAETNWPKMREVQMQNMLTVPNTGMAVTIDTGEKNDIHPTDKRPIGKRLALVAAAKFFGKDVEYMGPMIDKVTKQGDNLVISFTHADGIKVTSGETINNFEVSTDGATWTTAEAKLVDGKVQVAANGASKVRYCYTGFAENVNLYNGADLPAMPFNAAAQETGEWTVTPNGDSVQVSKTELNTDTLVKNEKLIVAVYKTDGTLVRVQSVPVTAIINENVSVSETFDISNGDYYKVMQWKDVDSITPVRAAQRFNK